MTLLTNCPSVDKMASKLIQEGFRVLIWHKSVAKRLSRGLRISRPKQGELEAGARPKNCMILVSLVAAVQSAIVVVISLHFVFRSSAGHFGVFMVQIACSGDENE